MVRQIGSQQALVAVAGIVTAHLAAVLAYAVVGGSTITDPRYLLYPIVWIGVAAWIGLRIRPRSAGPRGRILAVVVGVGYFVSLLWLTGHVGAGTDAAAGLSVSALPPGWGPLVTYDAGVFSLTIVPFQFVGYLALAYLVAIAVGEATTSLAAGALGLASCVGCTWPLVAGVAGATGAGWLAGLGGVAATATGYAYDLSTLLFLVSVGVLVWALRRQGIFHGT